MAGRVRHLNERNGRYEARLAVPARLRRLIGKREFVEALGGDRREALRRLPSAIAKFHAQIDAAQKALEATSVPPVARTAPLETAEQLALHHYNRLVQMDEEGRRQGAPFPRVSPDDARSRWLHQASAGLLGDARLEECVGDVIRRFQAQGQTTAEMGTREWRELAILIAAAELEATRRLYERDEGAYAGTLADTRLIDTSRVDHSISQQATSPAGSAPSAISISNLFDRWRLERRGGAIEETVTDRRYRPSLRNFVEFLGHDDALRVSNADVGRWIEHRLTGQRMAAKTVKDVDLAMVKGLFRWAGDNGHIPRVELTARVARQKSVKTRDRGLSDEEATKILQAAAAYQPAPGSRESPYTTAARRWAPWLCSLTGARISEIMQLRAEDICERDGIPFLLLTPEAGAIKTSEFREVPLHPYLAKAGFVTFANSLTSGPLFYNAKVSTAVGFQAIGAE